MKRLIILSLVLGAFAVPATTHGALKLLIPPAYNYQDMDRESVAKKVKESKEAKEVEKAQELKAQEKGATKTKTIETVVTSEVTSPTIKSTTTPVLSVETDDSEVIAELWEQIRILQAQIILLLTRQQL